MKKTGCPLSVIFSVILLCYIKPVKSIDVCNKTVKSAYFSHSCNGTSIQDLWYCGNGEQSQFFSTTDELNCVSKENTEDILQLILTNVAARECGKVMENGYSITVILQKHQYLITKTDKSFSFNCTVPAELTAWVRVEFPTYVDKEEGVSKDLQDLDGMGFYFDETADWLDVSNEAVINPELIVLNSKEVSTKDVTNGDNISLLIDLDERLSYLKPPFVRKCDIEKIPGEEENIISNGCGTGNWMPLGSSFTSTDGLQVQTPVFSVPYLETAMVLKFSCAVVLCSVDQNCALNCRGNTSFEVDEKAITFQLESYITYVRTAIIGTIKEKSYDDIQDKTAEYMDLEKVFRLPLVLVIVILGAVLLLFCCLVLCLVCRMRKRPDQIDQRSPYSARSSDVLLANDNWRIGAGAAPKARHVFGMSDDNLDDIDTQMTQRTGANVDEPHHVGFQTDFRIDEIYTPNPTQLEGASCRL